MAVLHHAFRCAATPDFLQDILGVLATWNSRDRNKLSAMAITRYAGLVERENIHAAFYLGPGGAVPSWLQPQFISPGLAALVMLAGNFVPLPTLSASHDTNHHRLTTHLPALGWSADQIDLLIHGQPIERMLRHYATSADQPEPGKFRHTGGWTSPDKVRKLKLEFNRLGSGGPLPTNDAAQRALESLNESKALDDARAMLAPLGDNDWLVMAITH